MRPIYDLRICDLFPHDLVQVTYDCGHSEQLTAAMLETTGVERGRRVEDLKDQLQCRECHEKNCAVHVAVQWGELTS
jgi:hypothetical protein